ncbi:MAG: hypothetical protein EWM48_03220 [Sphaerochaeta sp.]|jgi:N-acetylglucosamine kinase-like BadF-type ATPase|nr:MAG: hypothetical protein EWM48_03220 [Sphaerochaeta sp.]
MILFHTHGMEGIYLGGDGGGSTCRIGAWDRHGTLIAHATGSSSNAYVVGFDEAVRTVRFLIEDIRSRLEGRPILSFCFGNSGLARAEERTRWEAALKEILGSELPLLLVTDIHLLLAMNDPRRLGLCLISGTGSVALGRNEHGSEVRSGGMGSALGDEGSGWWIAREAIGRTLRSVEKRDLPTRMGKELLAFFKLPDYSQAISFFNSSERTKSEIARFTLVVAQAAEQGDLLALSIIEEAARELGLLVSSVQKRLEEPYPKRLIISGGTIVHNPLLHELLLKHLDERLEIHLAVEGGLEGARILAQQLITHGSASYE